MPKEALFLIEGYSSTISKTLDLDGKSHDVEVETKCMNLFELACASGSLKLVTMMLTEYHLRNQRDFKPQKEVHERMYLYIPILKQNLDLFEIVLKFVTLTAEDVRDLLWLMKQTEWTGGIEALLMSKACHNMYENLTFDEQNKFLWDAWLSPHLSYEDDDVTKETTTQDQTLLNTNLVGSINLRASVPQKTMKAIKMDVSVNSKGI